MPIASARTAALLALVLPALFFSGVGRAEQGQPQRPALASTTIPEGADRVSLPIGRVAVSGPLRLRVDSGSVFVRSVQVTREAAAPVEIALRRVLGPGDEAEIGSTAGRLREVAVLVTPPIGQTVSLSVLAPAAATAATATEKAAPVAGDSGIGAVEGTLPQGVRALAARALPAGGSGPLVIPMGRDKGRFDWLGVQVQEGAAAIAEIRMTLIGGKVLRFGVGRNLTSGDVVALALPGAAAHAVASITVIPVSNTGLQGRTVLQVLARYAAGWAGETGENRQMAAGWVLAGLVRPGGRRSERQVVAVGEDLGRYRRVRLVARNGDIDLREIVVTGSSGARETRSVNQPLFRDQPLPPIDLEGARHVDAIVISARARSAHAPDTALEVWLQH